MLLRDISFLLRTLSTLQCISQNYHFSSLYRLIIFFEPKRPKRPVDRVFSGLWTERCQYIPCHAAEVQESFMLLHAILRIYLKNTSRSRVFERVEVHLNGPNTQIPRWKRYFQNDSIIVINSLSVLVVIRPIIFDSCVDVVVFWYSRQDRTILFKLTNLMQ